MDNPTSGLHKGPCQLPRPVRDGNEPGITDDQGTMRATCANPICAFQYVLVQIGDGHRTEDNPNGEVWENRHDFERSLAQARTFGEKVKGTEYRMIKDYFPGIPRVQRPLKPLVIDGVEVNEHPESYVRDKLSRPAEPTTD